MTEMEHALMVGVLARQLQITKSILELLNSRDLLDSGDLGAFLALTQTQEAAASVVDAARHLYVETAATLGIETGL
jgi:hypothetical protein